MTTASNVLSAWRSNHRRPPSSAGLRVLQGRLALGTKPKILFRNNYSPPVPHAALCPLAPAQAWPSVCLDWRVLLTSCPCIKYAFVAMRTTDVKGSKSPTRKVGDTSGGEARSWLHKIG